MKGRKKMSDQNTIDDKILKSMLVRIIGLEKKNLRTNEFTDSEMKNKIKDIIEEELKCK